MDEEVKSKNAVVSKATIGYINNEFTFWIVFDYGEGMQQGFGGDTLDPEILKQIIDVIGVTTWEGTLGMPVRVKHTQDKIISLGNFLLEKWYEPKYDEQDASAISKSDS